MNINYFYVEYDALEKKFKLLGHSAYQGGTQLEDGRKYVLISLADAISANMNPIAFNMLKPTLNRILEEYENKKTNH